MLMLVSVLTWQINNTSHDTFNDDINKHRAISHHTSNQHCWDVYCCFVYSLVSCFEIPVWPNSWQNDYSLLRLRSMIYCNIHVYWHQNCWLIRHTELCILNKEQWYWHMQELCAYHVIQRLNLWYVNPMICNADKYLVAYGEKRNCQIHLGILILSPESLYSYEAVIHHVCPSMYFIHRHNIFMFLIYGHWDIQNLFTPS